MSVREAKNVSGTQNGCTPIAVVAIVFWTLRVGKRRMALHF